MSRFAVILGTGSYVPERVVTNNDMAELVDTSDEWIVSRTGIRERRISHVSLTDLAYVASMRALAAAGLEVASAPADTWAYGSDNSRRHSPPVATPRRCHQPEKSRRATRARKA